MQLWSMMGSDEIQVSSDREILERAVDSIAEQVAAAGRVVDEAHEAGLDDSHPLTIEAKMLRLELLQMKGYLERELGLLCSIARSAGSGSTTGAGSAVRRDTGRIRNPRPTAILPPRSGI